MYLEFLKKRGYSEEKKRRKRLRFFHAAKGGLSPFLPDVGRGEAQENRGVWPHNIPERG